MIAKMKKGDIILACPRTFRLPFIPLIYRLLLGARYVHSMLYLGGGKILHTTARYGVKIDRVPRKIYSQNRYTVCRVKKLASPQQREQIVQEAWKYKDKKLDHLGLITNIPSRLIGLKKPLLSSARNHRLWCSKLIYMVYRACHIELVPLKNTGNITSQDLSKSAMLNKI